jgi:hypothetical protein
MQKSSKFNFNQRKQLFSQLTMRRHSKNTLQSAVLADAMARTLSR